MDVGAFSAVGSGWQYGCMNECIVEAIWKIRCHIIWHPHIYSSSRGRNSDAGDSLVDEDLTQALKETGIQITAILKDLEEETKYTESLRKGICP